MENSEVYFKRNNMFSHSGENFVDICISWSPLQKFYELTHKDVPGYLLEPTEMPHRDNTECCVCQPHLSFILPAAGHLSDNGPQWLYPHGPQQKQLLPPGSRTREGTWVSNTGLQPSTWHSTKCFSSFQNPGKTNGVPWRTVPWLPFPFSWHSKFYKKTVPKIFRKQLVNNVLGFKKKNLKIFGDCERESGCVWFLLIPILHSNTHHAHCCKVNEGADQHTMYIAARFNMQLNTQPVHCCKV